MENGFNYYIVRFRIEIPGVLFTEVGERMYGTREQAMTDIMSYFLKNKPKKYQDITIEGKYCKVVLMKMHHKEETYFSDDRCISSEFFE